MLDKTIKGINNRLGIFLKKIKQEHKMHLVNPLLYESIKDFVSRKGKRIRPLLLILSYKGYKKGKCPTPQQIYDFAICIELLHCFMLIHDDIIDKSDLRRGKPTLHKILAKTVPTNDKNTLGCNLGIVAGDIVYALAIEAFLLINEDARRKEKALKYFVQTAIITAMGEFVDTLHGVQKINQVHEKDVFLNYSLKTARYTFECPLVMGAMLAGADDKELSLLSKLGLLIGQSFQIQDDIIGIFDTQKNIGKSILSDLTEEKKTILICHAYKTLVGKQRSKFMCYFTKQRKTYQDLLAIRKILKNSGSLEYSLKQLGERLAEARNIFKRLTIEAKYRKLIEESFYTLFKSSQQIAEHYNIPFNI